MQVSSFYKEVTHPTGRYSIQLLMTNNLEICRRKDWNQTHFESCIYIFVKKSNILNKLGWQINIRGEIQYFGFTKQFNPNKLFSNRPFKHRKDLLSKVISGEYICYCILGLSEKEAHCLEGLFISQSKKKLTKPGMMKLNLNHLINKRRELKWERLANKYLNLETQWK